MKILHISDLHLTDKDDFKNRLDKLIVKIKSTVRNNPIDVLALTGDVRNFDADFKAPIEFMETLLSKLDIKNVLIVPGNHDMNSCDAFISFDQRSECSLLDKNTDGKPITAQYNEFKKDFIDKVKNIALKIEKNTDRHIEVYHSGKDHSAVTIDGINFILINSVYAFNAAKIEQTELDKLPLCFNCRSLHKIFEGVSSDNTVAVMHAPLYLSCEKIRTGFSKADSVAELEQHFAFGIAGHTHQRAETSRYQLVGATKERDSEYYGFMTDDFCCAVYDVPTKDNIVGTPYRDNLEYNKSVGDFSKGGTDRLNEIYKLSESVVKKNLFGRALGIGDDDGWVGNSGTTADKLIVNGHEFSKSDMITLFDTMCKMKCVRTEEVDEFDTPTDIIARIIDIMNEKRQVAVFGEKMVIPVTIKGALGTGKSTFFNLLYWEMLLRQKHDFEYIPVLVDFAATDKEALARIIDEAKALKNDAGKPIYLLVDGLDNCKICNESAKELWEIVKSKLKGEECLLIFNINRHYKSFVTKQRENHRAGFGFIDSNKSSDYVLYFMPASQMEEFFRKAKNKLGFCGAKFTGAAQSETIDFVKAYFNLAHCTDGVKEIKLRNLMNDCPELDLDFHLLHWAVKRGLNDGEGRVYAELRGLFSLDERENCDSTEKAAVEYMMGNGFLSSEEMALLKSPTVINMMFAKYVVDIFAQDESGEKIRNYLRFDGTERPLPRWYFNTKLNNFIQLYLKSNLVDKRTVAANISNAIRSFASEIIDNAVSSTTPAVKVSYVAVAQMVYILRHAGAEDLSHCSNLIEDMINKDGQQEKGRYSRKLDVTKRTLDVSKISLEENGVYKYLNEMITSKSLMELNRCFTLFYYGDRDDLDMGDGALSADEAESAEGNDDKIARKRFRYYNAFPHLYYRVARQLDGTREPRPDFELDFFTLCNIVQIRAQKMIVEGKIAENRREYVYNTLSLVYELLNTYFDDNRRRGVNTRLTDNSRKIYYYYRSIQNDIGHLLIKHYEEERPDLIEARFNGGMDDDEHEFERNRLSKLKCLPFMAADEAKYPFGIMDRLDITTVDRAGWGVDLLLLRNDMPVRAESVAEHSFSLITLAMLLDIPKDTDEDNKRLAREQEKTHAKIRRNLVEMSFFHDIAESLYGDKRRGDTDYDLVQELVKNTTLSLCYLGTYDGFADLTDYAPLISRCLYGRAADDQLKNLFECIDSLQFGMKVVRYSKDENYKLQDLTGNRINEIYQDVKKCTERITRGNILYNLRQRILQELQQIIKQNNG